MTGTPPPSTWRDALAEGRDSGDEAGRSGVISMLTATEIAAALYLRRYRVDVEDNLLARKHVTQARILQRVATPAADAFREVTEGAGTA